MAEGRWMTRAGKDLGSGGRLRPRGIALIVALSIAALLLSAGVAIAAQPDGTPAKPSSDQAGKGEAAIVPNQYIVVLKDSVQHPGAVAERHAKNRGAGIRHVYRHALQGYAAALAPAEVKAVARDPQVAYVEPDVRGGVASQATPIGIDRIYATGNESLDIDETDDARIDVDVAVFDSGIDLEHPDLDVVSSVDCNGGIPPTCVEGGDDVYGHGTHVAGIIGAIDNEYGVVGVAPGARLWSVKVVGDTGGGTISTYIAGIDWVTGEADQIEVANASLRYPVTSSKSFDEALEASIEAGVVHVAAAGNEHETVKYLPGVHPDEITVSALEDFDGSAGEGDDPLASFSNFGSAVDVIAPGSEILSTVPVGQYAKKSGTSMATPHVAGAAAILASQDDPESQGDVEAVRDAIVEEGNLSWEDTSGDGIQEPLLDVSNGFTFPLGPGATTEAAGGVKGKEATLNAKVNPEGSEATYQFEYGKTTSYGTKVPVPAASAGSGTSAVEVSKAISGLSESTTYHYRVVASNEAGTTNGADKTFTTLKAPKAVADTATELGSTEAIIRGKVNPEGSATTYQFEYGTTTAYGTKVPLSPASAGSGTSDVSVSQTLSGLAGGTTYHYRVAASSAAGNTYSADATVTTHAVEWALQATPAVEVEEGEEFAPVPQSSIRDVSCTSTSDCMGVGAMGWNGSQPEQPLAQHWNGEEWSLTAIPDRPEEGMLTGVSCVSSEWCVAVGRKWSEESALIEHWNGSEWSAVPAPEGSSLYDVSCPSASDCTAVGKQFSAGKYHALALKWNGEEWSTMTTPDPASYEYNVELSGVSCPSASSCIAVGYYRTGPAALHSFAESFDGEEWSIAPDTGSNLYLERVSCTEDPALECTAISEGNHWAARFDGEEWSAQGLGEGSYPADISCTGATACMIVGREGGSDDPIALRWAGSEWSPTLAPVNPTPEPSGVGSVFGAVSCLAPTSCLAMGEARTSLSEASVLAESYWPVQAKATTSAATGVTGTIAALHATVNPRGVATTYQFEYGTTTSYGTKRPFSPASAGGGTSDVALTEWIGELANNTTYHYRVVASNGMMSAYGADKTFTTLKKPQATTEAASGVKSTEATLNAKVNPEGVATTYQFEYGKTTSYGTKVPVPAASAGSGTSDVAVSKAISGLTKGTTYHYRVVATSAGGSVSGGDKTFTTP
jgi:subtilisin family serine protease